MPHFLLSSPLALLYSSSNFRERKCNVSRRRGQCWWWLPYLSMSKLHLQVYCRCNRPQPTQSRSTNDAIVYGLAGKNQKRGFYRPGNFWQVCPVGHHQLEITQRFFLESLKLERFVPREGEICLPSKCSGFWVSKKTICLSSFPNQWGFVWPHSCH